MSHLLLLCALGACSCTAHRHLHTLGRTARTAVLWRQSVERGSDGMCTGMYARWNHFSLGRNRDQVHGVPPKFCGVCVDMSACQLAAVPRSSLVSGWSGCADVRR